MGWGGGKVKVDTIKIYNRVQLFYNSYRATSILFGVGNYILPTYIFFLFDMHYWALSLHSLSVE